MKKHRGTVAVTYVWPHTTHHLAVSQNPVIQSEHSRKVFDSTQPQQSKSASLKHCWDNSKETNKIFMFGGYDGSGNLQNLRIFSLLQLHQYI